MALSGLPHAPWSVALHCTIGVNEATRDFLRTMDVFHIITCGGAPLNPNEWWDPCTIQVCRHVLRLHS